MIALKIIFYKSIYCITRTFVKHEQYRARYTVDKGKVAWHFNSYDIKKALIKQSLCTVRSHKTYTVDHHLARNM